MNQARGSRPRRDEHRDARNRKRQAIAAILIYQLIGCGGGGADLGNECNAKGGDLVKNEAGDLVCVSKNPLPPQSCNRQGG